jgi:hypothetical protein
MACPQFEASVTGSSLWIPRFKFREGHIGYKTDRVSMVKVVFITHQSSHTTHLPAIAPYVRVTIHIIWGIAQ